MKNLKLIAKNAEIFLNMFRDSNLVTLALNSTNCFWSVSNKKEFTRLMAQNSYNAFLFEFLKFTFILLKSEDLSIGSFKTSNFNS